MKNTLWVSVEYPLHVKHSSRHGKHSKRSAMCLKSSGQSVQSCINHVPLGAGGNPPQSTNHSTNHNLAKNGCSTGFQRDRTKPQVLKQNKENLFYSLNECSISVDSWNLLKCVIQNNFLYIKHKSFLELKQIPSTAEEKMLPL